MLTPKSRVLTFRGVQTIAMCVTFLGPVYAEGSLPKGFVYLRNIDPTIAQDIRYATANNFTGAPVPGYGAEECIVARPAAEALKRVQESLRSRHLSLKVYDCYRPVTAVRAFVAWGRQGGDNVTTKRFYPRLSKPAVFAGGYIAPRSTHSRGTAVDLTLVPVPSPRAGVPFSKHVIYGPCTGAKSVRAPDDSLDMGTGWDCFDRLSHTWNDAIKGAPQRSRRVLVDAMQKQGFRNFSREWWHFSYPLQEFSKPHDFPIKAHSPP